METTTDEKSEVWEAPAARRWIRLLELATALLFAISLGCAWAMTQTPRTLHGNDFKHLWLGSWLLTHGRNPYDPETFFHAAAAGGSFMTAINLYVYLPTTGMLLGPLTWMPAREAMVAWFWFNWALAWAVVLAGPWMLRLERPAVARLAGAAFLAGSLTFFRQQTAGQMNVVTAALILGAAAALIRRRHFATGLFLALGFAWKIAPALMIAALGPLRRWRALAWGIVGSVGLLGASIALYGWPVHRAAVPVLQRMGYGKSTGTEYGMFYYRDPFNQSPNSLLHHLCVKNPHSTPWIDGSPALANGLTMLVSALLAGLWLTQALRRRDEADALPLLLAASLAMLLLPSLLWDHYAVQALPALMWVFGSRAAARSLWRAAAAVVILTLLTIPLRHNAPAWSHGPGILVMSLRLWPLLGLYLWLLFDRRLGA